MLHIPEIEEVKEDEEGQSKEIALTGTEIDEVMNKSDSQKSRLSDPDTHFEGDDWMVEEDGVDVDVDEQGSEVTASPRPIVVLGLELPMWFSKRRISWNRKCF